VTVSVELEFVCGTTHIGVINVGLTRRRCHSITLSSSSLLRRFVDLQSRNRNLCNVVRDKTLHVFRSTVYGCISL